MTIFPGGEDTFPDGATLHALNTDGTPDPSPPAGTYHSDLLALIGEAIAAIEAILNHGPLTIEPTADAIALTLKAFAGQAEQIQEWLDENGDSVHSVDPVTGAVPNRRGSGSPVAALITPGFAGQTYLDTTSGALYLVILNPDGPALQWTLLGGEIDGTLDVQGTIFGNGIVVAGRSTVGVQALLTDVDAYNDSGNGIKWIGNGADGGQIMLVRVGPPGSPRDLIIQSDGELDVPGPLYVGGSIHAVGSVISNAHVAPADGDLNNSDFATWLDDTPGATFNESKSKSSDGTVVNQRASFNVMPFMDPVTSTPEDIVNALIGAGLMAAS